VGAGEGSGRARARAPPRRRGPRPPGRVTLSIHELQDTGWPGAEAIDRFLAAHRFPLVEGSSVTFVYRGEADSVDLRHSVYGLPSSQAFRRIPATDLWYLILELPKGSRMEYKLLVERDEERSLLLDPLNPHTANDP